MTISHHFIIPDSLGIEPLADWLKENLELHERVAKPASLHYLDSDDWRLYAANLVLEEQVSEESTLLRLMQLYSRKLVSSSPIDYLPRFAFEISDKLLRKNLEEIIGTSELRIKASLDSYAREFSAKNDDEKIVLKAVITSHKLIDENKVSVSLGQRLTLLSVRGYSKPSHDAYQRISQELPFKTINEDLLLRALNAKTADYGFPASCDIDHENNSSHFRYQLAAQGIKNRLLGWLETATSNEPGIRAGLDPEHLHDFRVSIRRTRSALSHLRRAFPSVRIKPVVKGFRDLARASSALRDLDVLLDNLKQQEKILESDSRLALAPVWRLLQADHGNARKELLFWLDSSRYKTLVARWREVLSDGEMESVLGPNAPKPLARISAEGISDLFHVAVAQGQDLSPMTEPERLHDLRKTLKKLRYTLELFESLYDKQKIKKLLQSLKQLQEGLGQLQDTHVQMTALQAVQVRLEKQDCPAAIHAIDELIKKLLEEEQAARSSLKNSFAKFTAPENRRRFASLCSLPPRKPEI